jgi:DNA-binding NtrC family response regulator
MDRKVRLLIVDDEIQFLNALARRLVLRNFEVAKATNGPEALEAARGASFDLVLLDLKLPGMDGKEVLQVLRRENENLEVIILTGHGSAESAVECTRLGAFGYLPKPHDLDHLMKVLKEAYETRLKKKFKTDTAMLDRIAEASRGTDIPAALNALSRLDDPHR